MTKVMRCKDVGLDCDYVARGKDDEEIMTKVAEHAKEAHGMQDIPEEVQHKVKAAIHNE